LEQRKKHFSTKQYGAKQKKQSVEYYSLMEYVWYFGHHRRHTYYDVAYLNTSFGGILIYGMSALVRLCDA
jgi:hypothetical protein